MTKSWKCEICGHDNPEAEDICEECGSYREEPAYDLEADLNSEDE